MLDDRSRIDASRLLDAVAQAVIAIIGIIQLFQGQIIFGIILLVVAAAVGPGGWSIFNRNR